MRTKCYFMYFLLFIFISSCSNDVAITDDKNDPIEWDYDSDFLNFEELVPEGANIVFDKVIIDDNFSFMYQKTSGIDCGSSACLPTSYMMARKIVLPNAKFSVSELNSIASNLNMVCGEGASIDNAAKLAIKDFGDLTSAKLRTDDRTRVKNEIQLYLDNYLPIIARIEVSKSKVVTYINAAHFVVIVGLKLTNVGTGSTIFYIDPLSKYKKYSTCDYSTFLNSSKVRSGNYTMLPISSPSKIYP